MRDALSCDLWSGFLKIELRLNLDVIALCTKRFIRLGPRCGRLTKQPKGGKAVWFAVVIPGLTKSFYFAGEPADLGLSAIEVDSVLEISPYIMPSKIAGWATKPTSAE